MFEKYKDLLKQIKSETLRRHVFGAMKALETLAAHLIAILKDITGYPEEDKEEDSDQN